MDWSRHNYVTSIISTEKSIYRLVNSMIRMNCDRRRGHQRLTSSRSSGAGCPVMLTNVAAGAGRLVISVALFLVSSVTGEIRCFCNQPACVSTSYMCKSHIGMCFLQTTQDGDTTRTVHACAETLSENQRYACAQIEDDVTSTQKIPDENTRLDLVCCRTDMCNYKPRLFINIYISRINGTSATESLIGEGDSNSGVVSRWSMSGGQLLWFRVAVIVVPSIGAVLLAVIVYAAVRMLRNDGLLRNNNKIRRRHRSVERPPVNGCGAEGPLITKPYCIVLSSVSSGHQSQWCPQRICPEAYDKSSIRAELKSFEISQDSHAGTRESRRVYCELTLEECHCCCHGCACEYSKAVHEHGKNRSSGTDCSQPTKPLIKTSLRTSDDKGRPTPGGARSERTAWQDELDNRELLGQSCSEASAEIL